MTENLQTALVLMVVGMITVFGILALVVLTGNVLVRVINSIYKGEKGPLFVNKTRVSKRRNQLSPAQLAAIIAAVAAVTAGEGKIEKVERVS